MLLLVGVWISFGGMVVGMGNADGDGSVAIVSGDTHVGPKMAYQINC